MIRTVWFYLMLVVSSFVHAATVIVAALVGVKRRPGGRGIYDWGTTDWARDLLDAAGTPGGRRVGRGVPLGDAQPHRGAPPVQERAVRAGDRRAGAGRPRVRAPYL